MTASYICRCDRRREPVCARREREEAARWKAFLDSHAGVAVKAVSRNYNP